jgi:pimeloyl-ACP methyl ester carboxylesterase
MHVETIGSGAPLLLLHGAGVSGWMWRPVIDRIGSSARVLIPDLPGFGRSAQEPYTTHQATARELSKLISAASPDGAHVVGFSLGAQLAILLASQHRHLVRSVVVVSGETKPVAFPALTLGLLAASMPLVKMHWFARWQARKLSVPTELTNPYVQESALLSRRSILASVGENIRFTLPSTWPAFAGPAAVLVGAHERSVMHESARLTSDALAGCAMRTVDGSAHDIPFTRPDFLVSTVREIAGLPRAMDSF